MIRRIMSRTSATATSTTSWTISLWCKRSLLSAVIPRSYFDYIGNSYAAYLNMFGSIRCTINVSFGYAYKLAYNYSTFSRSFCVVSLCSGGRYKSRDCCTTALSCTSTALRKRVLTANSNPAHRHHIMV